jgi:2-amino-4-hydroxy-6-hydroxymethyldihydropteridine diphosphokinase
MHSQPVTAYVALGANLGEAKHTVQKAFGDIGNLPHTRLVAASSLYQTVPINSSGPDYINAVAHIATHLPAPLLLQHLQQIERTAGRQRPHINAPRTLDLDLLLYGSAQIFSDELTVPHPRMRLRAFVLQPLAEVAPELVSAEDLHAVVLQGILQLI